MTKPAFVRRYVRLEEGVPVLRCDDCFSRHRSATYWPLTAEFWHLERHGGLRRCRDCWRIENTAQKAEQRQKGGATLSASEAAYARHRRERMKRGDWGKAA